MSWRYLGLDTAVTWLFGSRAAPLKPQVSRPRVTLPTKPAAANRLQVPLGNQGLDSPTIVTTRAEVERQAAEPKRIVTKVIGTPGDDNDIAFGYLNDVQPATEDPSKTAVVSQADTPTATDIPVQSPSPSKSSVIKAGTPVTKGPPKRPANEVAAEALDRFLNRKPRRP